MEKKKGSEGPHQRRIIPRKVRKGVLIHTSKGGKKNRRRKGKGEW